MLIVCPSCATWYDIDLASLRPDGRRVRCMRCLSVWWQQPNPGEPPVGVTATPAPGSALGIAAQENGLGAPETGLLDETPVDTPEQSAVEAADPDPARPVEAPPLAPDEAAEDRAPLTVEHEAVGGRARKKERSTAVVKRRARRRVWQWRPQWSMLPRSAVLLLLIVDSILVGWRKDVARVLPQTVSFYALLGLAVNIRGLAFQDVATNTEENEGVPILVVTGSIVNVTGDLVEVPRLKLAVRNAAREEIYSWTAAPPRPTLAAGQAVTFRTRLSSPPLDSREVLVRFVNHRDIVAEVH